MENNVLTNVLMLRRTAWATVCALGACSSATPEADGSTAASAGRGTAEVAVTPGGRSTAGASKNSSVPPAAEGGSAGETARANTAPTSASRASAAAGTSASVAMAAGAGGVSVTPSGDGMSVPAAPSGAAGMGGAAERPSVACNPDDMLPEAKVIPLESITGSSNPAPIVPAKGPLRPVIEHDPGLDTHTVYRPMTLEGKYPIVAWANGGCVKNGTMFARFLLEIASHGFVIVADGKPNGSGGGSLNTDGGPQMAAMDWIIKENERPCSKYYHKLDTTKVAAMGQSCGGLMTLGASADPRLTTVVIWNSGLFERDEKIYAGLHTPVAYIIGGPDDVAYPQAEDDFAAINNVPLFCGNSTVGHTGTYAQDNGGEFAQVGIAWLKWQLYGENSDITSGIFLGPDCGLCKNPMWTVEKKMMD